MHEISPIVVGNLHNQLKFVKEESKKCGRILLMLHIVSSIATNNLANLLPTNKNGDFVVLC